MCGFCGILAPRRGAQRDELEDLQPMARSLAHRGPDDFGIWREHFREGAEHISLGLGHTRLAVLDLSSSGHQPMTSADGSVTVAYNGEIYNFREIRDELIEKGCSFRSECDTEVLVEAFRLWQLECFPRLNGMFAAAIWDAPRRRLLLVRDRLGIKPLYYRFAQGVLSFGSELRALRQHRDFCPRIDRSALGEFLRNGFVSGARTIYADTRRVLPGEIVSWQAGRLTRQRWWKLSDSPEEPPPASFEAAVSQLDGLLGDAVERRMIADVPLGAFLSGGIDSSAVTALMQERGRGRVRSFSIGFDDSAFDESAHARLVAERLGTQHTELRVSAAQTRDVALALPELYDEPFADSSAIPTVLLSRLTREHVTVALSGDGGDELFGGYTRYRKFALLERFFGLPQPLRRLLARAGRALPSRRLRRGLSYLAARDAADLAARLSSRFEPADLRAACGEAAAEVPESFRELFEAGPPEDLLRCLMLADAGNYLPEDILAKVDRASMSAALEVRVPLLDHRIVRFAQTLPRSAIWHEGRSKAPLRGVLERRLPRELFERPKQGFSIPLESLLAADLERWSERYLAPDRLAEDGHFDPAGVEQLRAACRGPGIGAERRWFLLCFQRWFAHTHRGESDA